MKRIARDGMGTTAKQATIINLEEEKQISEKDVLGTHNPWTLWSKYGIESIT